MRPIQLAIRLSTLAAAALLSACASFPSKQPPGSEMPAGAPQCGPQQYPFHALQNFQDGRVIVRADVRADGTVAGATVEVPSDNSYFNEAAPRAVRSCRLAPGARQVRLLVSYELFGQNRYLPNGYVIITIAPPAAH